MKNFQSSLSVFFLVSGILSIAWFFKTLQGAGLVSITEHLFFISYWMSEILIALLCLILSLALMFNPGQSRLTSLFLLGMLLSTSANAAHHYYLRDYNVIYAIIAGSIFWIGIVFSILLLKYPRFMNHPFIVKFGFLALGVLINFHLDIIVPHIVGRYWAAFLNSMFLLGCAVYYLVYLVQKRGDTKSSQ